MLLLFLIGLLFACIGCCAKYLQVMRRRLLALELKQDFLLKKSRQLEEIIAIDDLTGVLNRRRFTMLAKEYLGQGHQHGLAMIDLDNFKQINDTYGHSYGDQVLRTFAKVARDSLKDEHIIGRYGGEEFVLFLPNCDAACLIECCKRLRDSFTNANLNGLKSVSFSVGMTLCCRDETLDDALERADQALYKAKQNGKNQLQAIWTHC